MNTNGFYVTSMGKFIKCKNPNFKFDNIVCDCKLMYHKIKRIYTLYAPQYIKGKVVNDRNKIVSLDPGEKAFIAFYGLDHVGMIGEDIRIKISSIEKNIRQAQRKLSKIVTYFNDLKKDKSTNDIKKEKIKYRQKIRRIKKAIRKYYHKINNVIKELHNKTALFLCKNYDIILIPEFKTSEMVGNKTTLIKNKIKEDNENIKKEIVNHEELNKELKRYKKRSVLNSRVKFVLNMLSHYKFRQQLLAKSEEYGCLVEIVTEEYTSQCCGKCGKLSKHYTRRMKKCPHCKFEIDRDFNGSRNIMIMNINKILC